MNKRLASSITLALIAASGLCAQDASIPATSTAQAQVGRNRNQITEQAGPNTPGKHNLVVIVQRRAKRTCAEAMEMLAAMEQSLRVNAPMSYESFNRRYQKLVETDACGYEVYRSESHNLVTNAGLNWLADIMSNTSTPSVNAQCNYIALTNTAITPGATDTTLSGEIVANGLSRAQGTYTHTANATTYTISKTFTATGAQSAQAGGVFTASSGGTMCFEDTFTQATLATSDTIQITWTVTI